MAKKSLLGLDNKPLCSTSLYKSKVCKKTKPLLFYFKNRGFQTAMLSPFERIALYAFPFSATTQMVSLFF